MIIYVEQILIFWSWVSVCLAAFSKVKIGATLLLDCCWAAGVLLSECYSAVLRNPCYWIAAGWTTPNC